jgi:ATP-dependent RNA helicase DHX57
VKHIALSTATPGGILVFLPGVQEIRQCIEVMQSSLGFDKQVEIYPLHANLTNAEQRLVFKTTKNWKIIAATNVAEASTYQPSVTIIAHRFDRRLSLSMM